VTLQPPAWTAWSFNFGGGVRSFRFEKEASAFAPRSEITVTSRFATLGFEWVFARRWNFGLEVQKHSYPSGITELNRDAAAVLVPADALSYAFSRCVPDWVGRCLGLTHVSPGLNLL
jgi:hypothetical protein